MIVTDGGRGKPVFLYNLLDLKRTTWEGPELGAGKHLTFDLGPEQLTEEERAQMRETVAEARD